MRTIYKIFFLFLSLTAFSQESIIKDFAEDRNRLKLCFYPSTLRMINVSNNQEYDELIGDVEKLLIYRLDSATIASKEFSYITKEYMKRGYEEYISMSGPMNLTILGKTEEFVGVAGADDNVIAFFLKGAVALHKIPRLIQTFESGDIFGMITDQLR